MIVNPLYSVLTGMSVHAVRAAVAAHDLAHFSAVASAHTLAGKPSALSGAATGFGQGPADVPFSRKVAGFDVTTELVHMKIAAYGYSATAAVLLTQNETLGSIIDIIA
jgi:hypothetical protein